MTKASELWLEFLTPEKLCGLCANHGIVNTVGKITSPAGCVTGVEAWCICPNGRILKKQLGEKVVSVKWGEPS